MSAAKRYRVRSYADDVAETTVDLDEAQLAAVMGVLNGLGNQGSYTASFTVYEVDSQGNEIAGVMPL